MKCDDVKKIILLEYADGRLGDDERKRVEEHIAECPSCREFAEGIQVTSAAFKRAKEMDPPECVWMNIKDAISEEENAGSFGWIDRIREGVSLPRPAFAAAAVTVVFLTVVISAGIFTAKALKREKELANYIVEEQVSTFEYMDAVVSGKYMRLDTSIEEFLM